MMLLFFNGIVVWNLWQVQWKCAHSASSFYIYWRMDPLLFNDNTMMIKPHDDEHQFSNSKKRQLRGYLRRCQRKKSKLRQAVN